MNPARARDRSRAERLPRHDLVGLLTDGVIIAGAVTLLGLLLCLAFPTVAILLLTLFLELLAPLSAGSGQD